MSIFFETLTQIVRLFIYVGIGALFNKRKIIPSSFETVVSKLITNLFLPMMVFSTFITNCTVKSLSENASLILCGSFGFIIMLVLGLFIVRQMRMKDMYQRGVMRYAYIFPNTGGFLTPLILASMGLSGYYRSSLFCFPWLVMTYLWGVFQLTPYKPAHSFGSLLKKLLNPAIVSTVFGAIAGILGAAQWIPSLVMDGIQQFGDCYVPMSMILLGYTFADFSVKDMVPDLQTWLFILLRMILLPLMLLLFFIRIRMPQEACFFIAAATACPCGMNTIVFPISYGKDVRRISKIVLCSSLASLVTIPSIYVIANLLL